MINVIERAKSALTEILPVGVNLYTRKAAAYAVVRQVDQWFGRADNLNNMQYDLIQVDVWTNDAPDYALEKRVVKALEAAGFKRSRRNEGYDDAGAVVVHRISQDYQFQQEYEEV